VRNAIISDKIKKKVEDSRLWLP